MITDNNKFNDKQQIVTGTIKQSKSGGEVITFTVYVPIFSIKIDFVVTVPGDGSSTAPVYIHTKLINRKTRRNKKRINGNQNDVIYDEEDDDIGNRVEIE